MSNPSELRESGDGVRPVKRRQQPASKRTSVYRNEGVIAWCKRQSLPPRLGSIRVAAPRHGVRNPNSANTHFGDTGRKLLDSVGFVLSSRGVVHPGLGGAGAALSQVCPGQPQVSTTNQQPRLRNRGKAANLWKLQVWSLRKAADCFTIKEVEQSFAPVTDVKRSPSV